MTEHRTCLQKAIDVVGHEEGCKTEYAPGHCTCSPSLDMLVAAGRGRLARAHPQDVRSGRCARCGTPDNGVLETPGPCYSPVDDAEVWRLLGDVLWVLNNELIAADRETYSVEQFEIQQRARLQWSIAQRGRLTIEAISRLWIALHDAGLLEANHGD